MFVRSRILLVLALLVTGLLLPATILPAGPARAAACADAQTNPVLTGGFEIDGNLCSNTSGSTGPLEWDAVAGQPIASDPRAQADGTAFSGTSEDGWPWSVAETSGSNPSGNADITQVFGYSQVSNDHVYAYVGWERAAIQGTAGFFVELNQKPNLRGPVPDRTDGDLRLRFIQQGNTLLTLDAAYLWTSTGPTSGTWDAIPVGPYQARVNAGTVSNLPGLTPDPMPAGTFAEAAVDLTGLFAGAGECSGHLGYMNLRSVSSLQATHPPLQDWVEPVRLGVPPTCPTVVLRKHWINGADGDTAALSINGAAAAPGANISTAGGQASLLDTDHQAIAEVEPGSTVELDETIGAGNTGTYTSSLTCDGGSLTASTTGASGTLTMPPDAGAGDTVTCTLTNTRTSATLALTKVWDTAIAGDAVDVSIEAEHGTTGPTTSTAPNSTTITATVFSGEDVAVVEIPGDANTASYRATTTCTGIDGFSGAEFGASFVVPDNPGPMSCTITNVAIPAQITLFKHWVHGAEGDTAGLAVTDGTQSDSAVATVPPSGTGESAQAATVPILPGDSVTLSEVLPAAGRTNTGLYHPAALTCNGRDVPFTSSTSGADAAATATYTVTSSAAVTCTITNEPRYRIVLTKAWGANAVPGDRAHLAVTNTTTGTTGAQTAVAPDPPTTPASVIAAGGDRIEARETIEGGGTYASAIECDHGARTAPARGGSATLTVPSDLTAGTSIVCIATNLARYRVTLTKAWRGDVVAGDPARLTLRNVSTGQSAGPTTAHAPHPPAPVPSVTAAASDLIDVRESLGAGAIGSYATTLQCSAGAFDTPAATPAGQFEVPADLPAGTHVACTLTNTARAVAPGPGAARPAVRTATSRPRVTPGRAFRDRIHVRGLARGQRARAVARLYGPFPSRAAATCGPAAQVRTRGVTVRNGWTATAPVRVRAPGVYTWRVTVLPSAHNWRATHRCGQVAETTTVAKAGYTAPDVDGGLDGTLDPSAYRAAPVTLSMLAIGVSAPVRTEAIAAGAMTLPADVGEVGWLRASAGVGDAIGTTVIGGHVSDRHDRPGALYHLDRARVGQVLTIRQGRTAHRFVVTGTHTYVRGTRLPQGYFATTGPHRLVLISCADRVVHPDGRFHYTHALVVEARPVR